MGCLLWWAVRRSHTAFQGKSVGCGERRTLVSEELGTVTVPSCTELSKAEESECLDYYLVVRRNAQNAMRLVCCHFSSSRSDVKSHRLAFLSPRGHSWALSPLAIVRVDAPPLPYGILCCLQTPWTLLCCSWVTYTIMADYIMVYSFVPLRMTHKSLKE